MNSESVDITSVTLTVIAAVTACFGFALGDLRWFGIAIVVAILSRRPVVMVGVGIANKEPPDEGEWWKRGDRDV